MRLASLLSAFTLSEASLVQWGVSPVLKSQEGYPGKSAVANVAFSVPFENAPILVVTPVAQTGLVERFYAATLSQVNLRGFTVTTFQTGRAEQSQSLLRVNYVAVDPLSLSPSVSQAGKAVVGTVSLFEYYSEFILCNIAGLFYSRTGQMNMS